MSDTIPFILGVLALLATPGPTNTLMAAAGAQHGVTRSLPLLAGEVLGYFIAITAWTELVGAASASQPWVPVGAKLLASAFLIWSAWKLWQNAGHADFRQSGITLGRVFGTTLVNPKALVFAFAIFPPAGFLARLPYLGPREGQDDFAVIDTQSWNQVHLRVYRSTGTGLTLRSRHYGTISNPGGGLFWTMRRADRLHALDYDDDGITNLAIFNGQNWGPVYLGMMKVEEGQLQGQKRYDNVSSHLPGWQMQRGDRFKVADVNGDGRQDLVVFNATNWSTQYLGILRSTGGGNLSGTWQDDWIGGWNLGSVDQFHVADFRGTGNWDDIFVHNKNWLGLLRSHSNHYKLESIYHKWIHNHRFHSAGLW